MDCNLTIKNFSLRLVVVYRPPPSRANGLKPGEFLENEWPTFLSKFTTLDKQVIIVGDLNFHFDTPSERHTSNVLSTLESFGMRQHVNKATHVGGHTLDVVITRHLDDIV